ncbi:hypothetical protein PR048_010764 [Dryococelus australis]|uniref:Uncharacterized protein n=1 Tax=Dryococelus australis TaxID=614101 RepID=A0ABQ9I5K0_9NEOP|nr:hypothetical protein PR048_010764 [Dryococelus australis]
MNFISISIPVLNSNGSTVFRVDLRCDLGLSFEPPLKLPGMRRRGEGKTVSGGGEWGVWTSMYYPYYFPQSSVGQCSQDRLGIVQKIETGYWGKDGVVSDVIDSIVVRLDYSSYSSSASGACSSISEPENPGSPSAIPGAIHEAAFTVDKSSFMIAFTCPIIRTCNSLRVAAVDFHTMASVELRGCGCGWRSSARLGRARQSSTRLRGCSDAVNSGLTNVPEGARQLRPLILQACVCFRMLVAGYSHGRHHYCGTVTYSMCECLHVTNRRITILHGATVAERLARSPPTKAHRAQSPSGSPDLRKGESCWTMPLVGGSSRRSPISPVPSFRAHSILTSITLIGSQDLAQLTCRLTHYKNALLPFQMAYHPCWLLCSYKHVPDKGQIHPRAEGVASQ